MTLLRSLINGVETSSISIEDRGLLYGHNVFETIMVQNNHPLLLDAHLQRLRRGANSLAIPLDSALIKDEIIEFCQNTNSAVLRVCLTIGTGGRGYASPSKPNATRILSLHTPPEYNTNNRIAGIEIGFSDIVLSTQPILAGIKHANRLEQVLARAQWHPDWQEALLSDEQSHIVEGTMSNLFMVNDQQLYTPQLTDCGVQGVMRDTVLEKAQQLAIKTHIMPLSIEQISHADGLFMTNSVIGIWPVRKLQQQIFNDFTLSQTLLDALLKDESISIN